jgi:outer membrane protein assembly factor BamB
LWPGVAAVTLQLLVRFGLPLVWPDGLMYSVLGGVAGALLVVIWWLFFSRAAWVDRLGGVALMAAAMALTPRILDRSLATGAMGFVFYILAVPWLCLAFVVAVAVTRQLSDGPRRATIAAVILLACGGWALIRTNGIRGEGVSDLAWRWTPTPEDRLVHASEMPAAVPTATIARKTPEPVAVPAPVAPKIVKPTADWPGFRGPHRDGVVTGVKIDTDWSKSPPVQMWRRPIGPGWSSFAVHGDLLYTQEQRGSDEVVACYRVSTGEPVWIHRDAARFWESNAGAGPRATPTLSNGRVYTFGATGIVNALDAATGAVVWSRNAGTDTGVKVPEWAFASSPLVIDDLVVIAAAGKLAAYDIATGEPRWYGPNGRSGYSSPHLVTIDGVAQILLLSGPGATSLAIDGTKLWEFALPAGARITQPAQIADGDLLVNEGESHNLHRIAVTHGPTGWTAEERWNTNGLKPYFSDFVIHNGRAFGFDGNILSCIDLKDGKRVWKGGRYGSGQLVLLADQDVLLVLSEEGELALASAATDQFKELARFPGIEGKTWNHPVVVGDVLLVRNGEEMAAFRLALAH